jgi:hypothetical protein
LPLVFVRPVNGLALAQAIGTVGLAKATALEVDDNNDDDGATLW